MHLQIGVRCKIATRGPQVLGLGSILQTRCAWKQSKKHTVNTILAETCIFKLEFNGKLQQVDLKFCV